MGKIEKFAIIIAKMIIEIDNFLGYKNLILKKT